jgi:predicted secreted hydrolase
MRDTKSAKSKIPVEKPHPESAIEWWFYHGFFEGKKIGKRFFMVTFFRHNQPKSTKDNYHPAWQWYIPF